MYINQISVFVENRVGRLSEITEVLSKENIDIRALSIADTTDFGILRLIVSEPENCCQILKQAGITAKLTKVLAVQMLDKPGELHRLLMLLRSKDIDVEYAYAFISRLNSYAYVVLRVEDTDTAVKILTDADVKLLTTKDLCDA